MTPRFHSPQLCTLIKAPFSDPDWLFEEKLDGIRCIVVKKGDKVTLYSRNKKNLTEDFPNLVEALKKASKKDYVADGELVAFDKGITSFSKLQKRKIERVTSFLYLFDLIILGDQNLKKMPLIERKKLLKSSLRFSATLKYLPHTLAKGDTFYKKAKSKHWEGIIGKRKESPYSGKRNRDWIKCKLVNSQEFVIGGFTEPKNSRVGFGALHVGYYKGKELLYAGKIGTGFDQTLLKSLTKQLQSLKRASCPFHTEIKSKDSHWVRPSLVCEVAFTEWTERGQLRHPSFLGLRKDKRPKQVKKES